MKPIQKLDLSEYGLASDFPSLLNDAVAKINELCDAINELQNPPARFHGSSLKFDKVPGQALSDCPECGGEGVLYTADMTKVECSNCGGSGRV